MAAANAYEEQRRMRMEENKRKFDELRLPILSAAFRQDAAPQVRSALIPPCVHAFFFSAPLPSAGKQEQSYPCPRGGGQGSVGGGCADTSHCGRTSAAWGGQTSR